MTVIDWLLERMSELTSLEISLVIPADYESVEVAVLVRAQAVGQDFTIFTNISNLRNTDDLERLADLLRYQMESCK